MSASSKSWPHPERGGVGDHCRIAVATDTGGRRAAAVGALNPLDHAMFQAVFGMVMTLLIAMEFKHSITRVMLRRDRQSACPIPGHRAPPLARSTILAETLR